MKLAGRIAGCLLLILAIKHDLKFSRALAPATHLPAHHEKARL